MSILKIIRLFAKGTFNILIRSLAFLESFSINATKAVQQLSKNLKNSITYQLVPIDQMLGFEKIVETHGGIENIALPKIIGLSNGGSIEVNMPGDNLCKLCNVSFVPCSDFIRSENGKVSNEKLLRKEYDVLIPRDRDIIEIKEKIIRLSKKKHIVHSKIAFNLMGTYSLHWAHFLAQYYPKLSFLDQLPKSEHIDLIIPKNTDPHIKYLIDSELKSYPQIQILSVDLESEIICENLYHVTLGTLLADDSYFPTPFATLISKSTINFWNMKAKGFVTTDSKKYRKIFVGRTGGRSLKNYKEILDYFIENGFEEVFPHLLSFDDKIRIFNEAKLIVGPYSSGFFNAIYSKPNIKILAFVNSYRYLDAYFPSFCKHNKHEFWIMTGKDENLNELNSSYEINLNSLKNFLNEVHYLDNIDIIN